MLSTESKHQSSSPKDSWIGVFLGSGLIAALVTASSYFFLDRKSQYSTNNDFVLMVSNIVRNHDDTKSFSTVEFLQMVALPLHSEDARHREIVVRLIERYTSLSAKKVVLDETNKVVVNEANDEPKSVLDSQLNASDPVVTLPNASQALQDAKLVSSERTIQEIRESLYSNFRRQFSDILVREINDGKQSTVDSLVDAILPSQNIQSYRVNLYIVYTLARSEKWKASPERKSLLDGLASTPNYRDPTFKENLDRARLKYRS